MATAVKARRASSDAAALLDSIKAMFNKMEGKFEKLSSQLNQRMDNLEATVKKEIGQLREEVNTQIAEMSKEVKEVSIQVQKMEIRTQQIETKTEATEKFVDQQSNRVSLLELKLKERSLRLRDVEEEKDENIRQRVTQALAPFLGMEEDNLNQQVDEIHRTRYKLAKQRNVPRDIVITFVKKELRDKVLNATRQHDLIMNGKRVYVFKELPPPILRKRKDYAFLTYRLKAAKISYRWDNLEGLSVYYQDKRHFLNTVQKAQDFARDFLSQDSPRQDQDLSTSETVTELKDSPHDN